MPKKKIIAAKRNRIRTTHKSEKTSRTSPSIKRVTLIITCILLTIIIGITQRHMLNQAVAGVSVMQSFYLESYIPLPSIEGATSYNIYYKQVTEKEFTHTVRSVPNTETNYRVSHLQQGVTYHYKIAAVDAEGKEFLWSETVPLVHLKPMQ